MTAGDLLGVVRALFFVGLGILIAIVLFLWILAGIVR